MMDINKLPNQRPDEHVVLFLRRHWVALVPPILGGAVFLGGPLITSLFFESTIARWLADPVIGPLTSVLGSIYLLSVWLFLFIEFTDYYLDTWIVTTERVISIEMKGLFHRTASELDLAAVQDTTSEMKGVLQSTLTYGSVYVQTAGEVERFHFKMIDNPEKVKELITQLVEADKRRLFTDTGSSNGKVHMGIK